MSSPPKIAFPPQVSEHRVAATLVACQAFPLLRALVLFGIAKQRGAVLAYAARQCVPVGFRRRDVKDEEWSQLWVSDNPGCNPGGSIARLLAELFFSWSLCSPGAVCAATSWKALTKGFGRFHEYRTTGFWLVFLAGVPRWRPTSRAPAPVLARCTWSARRRAYIRTSLGELAVCALSLNMFEVEGNENLCGCVSCAQIYFRNVGRQ